MSITLTVESVTQLLNEAVAEKGADYVYPDSERLNYEAELAEAACAYVVYEGDVPVRPSCIVGNVLHRAGIPLSELAAFDDESAGAYCVVNSLVERGLLNVVDASTTTHILTVAQANQDVGMSWGEAAAKALRGVQS